MKRSFLLVLIALMTAGSVASAQYDPEFSRVLSRLQALSHGVISPREWEEALAELQAVESRALAEGKADLVVQARAIKAMALADLRRDVPGALRVIEETLRSYGQQRLPSVRRLFIQQAEYFGRIGDADGVRRTIEAFRRNPNYDPQEFPVILQEGRNTPMLIARPFAKGSESVSITAMEAARERARYAPGNLFPDFAWVDGAGRRISLRDLRGKVVLVDFWHHRWTPWARDLPNLKRIYQLYRSAGFEIVGVSLDPDGAEARNFATTEKLPWPLVFGETELPRQLALFGRASNFLLDRNGVIIARDLRGSDLSEATRRALAQ